MTAEQRLDALLERVDDRATDDQALTCDEGEELYEIVRQAGAEARADALRDVRLALTTRAITRADPIAWAVEQIRGLE